VDSFQDKGSPFPRYEQTTHTQTIPFSTQSQKHYSCPQFNDQDNNTNTKNTGKKQSNKTHKPAAPSKCEERRKVVERFLLECKEHIKAHNTTRKLPRESSRSATDHTPDCGCPERMPKAPLEAITIERRKKKKRGGGRGGERGEKRKQGDGGEDGAIVLHLLLSGACR
jgi:hypothetical protein